MLERDSDVLRTLAKERQLVLRGDVKGPDVGEPVVRASWIRPLIRRALRRRLALHPKPARSES